MCDTSMSYWLLTVHMQDLKGKKNNCYNYNSEWVTSPNKTDHYVT